MYAVFDGPVNALGFNIIGFGDFDPGIFGTDVLRLKLSFSGSSPETMDLFSSAEPFDPIRFFGILTTLACRRRGEGAARRSQSR